MRKRVLIIGDSGVGKTTLARRLAGVEDLNPDMTRGVEFYLVEGYLVWDLSGQEKFFKPLEELALKGDFLALLVADNTRPSTLYNIRRKWAKKLPRDVSKALVMNKLDLARPPEEGREVAKELRACYIECSAKTGEGVDKVVEWIRGKCPSPV